MNVSTAHVRWLLVSAGLEIIVSCVLGFAMLLPMQPWARRFRERWPHHRAVMSVHLDLIMLALMQVAAAGGMRALPGRRDGFAAVLLIASGWMNVTPYVWRLLGVDGFALAGGPLQVFAASLGLVSTLALTTGWVCLVLGWMG